MKDKKSAFTLVELLVVLGIIAILVALLIPALAVVRKMAKETQQKAQLTTIEMGLTAFKNDYGDYPPSHGYDSSGGRNDYYCGAQTLAEALVGWDLMGFHPKSIWDSAGTAYEPPTPDEENLKKRVGPYVELATANAFRLNQLFTSIPSGFNPNTFVICDVFGVTPVTIGGKTVKAGAPILYYRANTSSKTLVDSDEAKRIYNRKDDYLLVYYLMNGNMLLAYPKTQHPNFYDYIADPKVTMPWPYRPDSYILISAGADGFYGTSDDIRNF